ncbi:GTPase SLIP-GC, partial [Tupaia chinensis]
DDGLFKEPIKKRRRSDRDQRFRAFPSVEQSALKEYEKLESRTRRVLSNTYQKLIQSVFLDDSIPNGVKYLINRLLVLIEKPSLDPIYIGLFGSTGAGKSSLINAIIQQAMFLPVSGESICTSCIVQVSSGCCEQYEAKIHLLSDQEWKEELKNLTKLLHRTEELGGEEMDSWDRDDAMEEAIWKLQMIYGNGAEKKSYEELLRAKLRVKIPTSRIITLKVEEAEELSVRLDPYIRTQRREWDGGSPETQIWPLIKYVEVTLPKSELIPEGVVLVDIPGTGDFNSKRDEMWKKTIDKCSVIWVISDIERVSGGRAHEDLLNESIRACQRGFCGDIALRKLPADSKILEASDLVYTVSAQEYWQQATLTEEETGIPRLREYIRKRLLDEKRRTVTKYITEAFGLLLLTDSFSSTEKLLNEHVLLSGLRRFVEEKIEQLEKAIGQCFAHIELPLQEGRSKGNQGFHQTLKAVCLKNGIYASRTLARIDLNEAITQPIYDQIDPVFGSIFRNGPQWSSVNMASQISAILGGLEGHILRRKRRIYESLSTSVQNDLKPCYEEAAQITGKKACERMKDVIRRGVDRQVAEGMFERAQERMQHQFQQLKNGITEKVRGSIATMLTLASSHGDGLYKELADVKNEYKEMEKLQRSLKEVAENALLRRGMQDFLLRMSPSKAGSPK